MFINNVNSSSKYYSNSVASTRYANATSYVHGVQKSDAFTPSKEAQSFSELLNKLKNSSEVREDRVQELQQKISLGQYFVSSADIASSLLTNRY
ncbi:MAG: flagellar biosynthesis anti-sigma factor FlgM [Selenomonadaceae bacterium]|nr:flagellar biosynthesis anti-sigma factor FlgM [Selenomonadaceae bacterium]